MTRSEIWLVNLDPTLGAEIKHTRPAVIVSDDDLGVLPLRVVVPLTDWKEQDALCPWITHIIPDLHNGLAKSVAADAFQVQAVSHDRLIRPIGYLSAEMMQKITRALARVLAIE